MMMKLVTRKHSGILSRLMSETTLFLFFRVFAKDEEGCIHPDEIKFVLKHLPSDLEIEEIEEMIEIVDKNKDGKISYSEFRVRFKVLVLLIRKKPVTKSLFRSCLVPFLF